MFFALLTERDKYMLPCVNKRLFGFDCPGCGMQRAMSLLVEGNFAEAFHMYPAIYNLILLAGYFVLRAFVKIRYDNWILRVLIFSAIALIIGNYILKLIN
ncbi:MAG: DUF2752 domain-containing protein [Flavobacteriaceae bacterium]|nr:DUF2752 domain-containing protein [Flavobacteriaceae bacterium]